MMLAQAIPAQPVPEKAKLESKVVTPLFELTADAFAWRFLSESSKFILQFAVTVTLARLLPVDAFGLLALCVVIVNFASRIAQIGMAPAVIQRRRLSETHVRVAFTVSVISGVGLTAALWCGAPEAAVVFRQPAVAPILRLISFSFFFTSLGTTASALLERRLEYRKLFGVELISYALGYALIGITLATLDYGVWALGWATVGQSLLRAALLFLVSPHCVRPSLARSETRELLNFGVGSSLGRIANYAAINGDNFVVGRWLGAPALGLYARAYQLMALPIYQYSSVISDVLFPAYSKIQNEQGRLRRGYLASISLSSIVIFPVLTTLVVTAPELIVGVLGAKWEGAIRPFQVLCVGGALQSVYNLGDSLARASGAVYAKFWRHTTYALFVVTGSLIGSRWGITGVSVGVVAATAVIYILMAHLSINLTSSNWRTFFVSQRPGVVVAAAVGGLSLPITLALRAAHLHPLFILVVAVLTAAVTGITVGLKMPRRWIDKSALAAISTLNQRFSGYAKTRLRRSRKAYEAAQAIYENSLALFHILRRGLWRTALIPGRKILGQAPYQSVITWEVAFPSSGGSSELVDWLRASDIIVMEGAHTYYIPPQERLAHVIPSVVGFYPRGAGFKLLKDYRPPERARYLNKQYRYLVLLMRLIGRPRDQLIAANYMYCEGIGPRLWDLTCWRAEGRNYTVFVTDHVTGETPNLQQGAAFLDVLRRLDSESHLRVLMPRWEHDEDFRPPAFKSNLIYSESLGKAQYIDFQNFGLTSPGAWSREIVSSAKSALENHDAFRHPVSPAREGERLSSAMIAPSILRRVDLDLHGRIVLDIGCNLGMILYSALAAGAAWGFGWERPDVVTRARDLLFSLGATRFSLSESNLDTKYRFEDDIPARLHYLLSEGVVFHLGYSTDAPLPETLLRIPWRVLIVRQQESEPAGFGSGRPVSPLLDKMGLSRTEFRARRLEGDPITVISRK